MNRLTVLVAVGLATIANQNLCGGPERLESKDSKTMEQAAVEQPCRWTGFYLGAHGGYSWGDSSFLELNEIDPPYLFDQGGFFGGGQIGFNWQLGSLFVLGVEGTFAGGDFSDTAEITSGGELSRGDIESNWIGTVAARVGLTFCKNRLLAFAKGGVAFTQFDYHTTQVVGSEVFDANEDRIAPLIGAGLEYALTCHWSVKLEYNHLFFDAENVTGTERGTSTTPGSRTFRSDISGRDTVSAGINFKF
jgi:outer membrane immunogenic protein